MDKLAGLTTQIRNLKKRLDAIDTSKGDPSEIKNLHEAISALEDRLAKHHEAKKQRKLEKETKEKANLEVTKEAKPEEPARAEDGSDETSKLLPRADEELDHKDPDHFCRQCLPVDEKELDKMVDNDMDVAKEMEVAVEADAVDDIMQHEDGGQSEEDEIAMFQRMINDGSVWHLQGSYGRRAMELLKSRQCELGEKPFKDAYGNRIPSRSEVKPGTMGSPLNNDVEAAPKALPPLEAPRYEIKEDAPQREYRPLSKHVKDEETRRMEMKNAPHIISEMPKEGQFELDAEVEPVRGTPGSKGRVMRHDSPQHDVLVVWDEGKLKDLHGHGMYNPKDLKKKEHVEAALDREGQSNQQVIDLFVNDSFPKDKMPSWGTSNLKIKKYPQGWALVNYATPIMYRDSVGNVSFNTQKYSPTTSTIQNQIRKSLGGMQANEVDEGGIFQAMNYNADLEPKAPAEKPGMGYGGDRPGVNVAPMRDEDVSLHSSATLKKSVSKLKAGETVTVLKIDAKTKSVKYASLKGDVKGWAPMSYFDIVASVEKKAVVVHENGKWHVKSHDGKDLGGYPSKDEADKRLREIEHFKSHKAHRLSRLDKVGAEVATQTNYSELTEHIDQMRERIQSFSDGLKSRASIGPDPENKDFKMLMVSVAELKQRYANSPEAMEAIKAIEADLAECGKTISFEPKVEAAVTTKADMPPKPTNDPGLNMMWFYDDQTNTWEIKPKTI